jgi:antitoxin component YwqK of YwqJK toxin-antitoxin module
MSRQKYLFSFIAAIAISVFVIGSTVVYFVNSCCTEGASFSSGQIVRGEFGKKHRRFIQVADDGFYVIQDFHASGKPLTNPYRVKRDDLLKDHSEQFIDGLFILYYSNCWERMIVSNYRNGLKDGVSFAIYNSGKISYIRHFVRGKQEGDFTTYFRNGNKLAEGSISNNESDITTTTWYFSGAKQDDLQIHNNVISKGISWYESGAKKREGGINNGKGHWMTWYENGQISSVIYFKNSIPVKCSEYGEDGIILHKDEISRAVCEEIYTKKGYYSDRLESDDSDGLPDPSEE